MITSFILSFCISLKICSVNLETHLIKNFSFTSNTTYNTDVINNGKIIKPMSTWIKILSSDMACLFYKVPYKGKSGELNLVKNSKSCSFNDDSLFSQKNIKSISLSKTNDKYTNNNLSLELTITTINDREVISIPLLKSSLKKTYDKYSNNVDIFYYDSVILENSVEERKIDDGNSCHAVNSSCISVTQNNCSMCKNGFHEVVDYNCPQGGSKYCGQIKCGQKDSPACPRGYEILDSKLSSLCFEGSPAGYCAPGFRTYCNEQKILVCL